MNGAKTDDTRLLQSGLDDTFERSPRADIEVKENLCMDEDDDSASARHCVELNIRYIPHVPLRVEKQKSVRNLRLKSRHWVVD